MKENIYDKIFDKKCAVCNCIYKADVYDQGKCLNCGWNNGHMSEENPSDVIFPNHISLNKARKLYTEGKPFTPSIFDFMGMLYFYSEVKFKYNNKIYGVIFINDGDKDIIGMYESQKDIFAKFENDKDFINNAKIDNKFLKDIWDAEISDVDWL